MPTFVARSGSLKDLKVSSSLLVSGSVNFTTLTTPPTTVSDVLIISSSGRVFVTASTALGGGSGYNTIQEEGSSLTQRTTIDFVGAGVTATDNGSKTVVTIPGGGTPPGGVEYSVQFNSASVLEGDDNFLYQYESRSLSLGTSGGGAPPAVNAVNSMAVGYNLNISGSDSSVAFGQNNNISGSSALAMGDNNIITTNGDGGFVGGGYSLVSGNRSIAFGLTNTSSGDQTAAFNLNTHASGNYSFAANAGTVAKGIAATALGQNTIASGAAQTVVGQYNIQGNTTDLFVVGNGAGLGSRTDAFGVSSTRTFASGNVFLPGLTTTNQSNVVTINTTTGQLYYTASTAFGGGGGTPSSPEYSIQFNSASAFKGDNSFIFQYESRSLAQGINAVASGLYSHAEGQLTLASGASSHAEGYSTIALGVYAHSEGNVTSASGQFSHAEGSVTKALGTASHAEGIFTVALGDYSHASGLGTITSGSAQTAIGNYNTHGNTTDLFIIGKGGTDLTRADMLGISTTRMFSSGAIYFPDLTTTNQSNVVTINTTTGQLYYTASSAFGGGSGVTINNNVDNYILTATGTANTINGESNFRFNGSTLSVTGSLNSSGSVFFPMLTTTNQSNVVTINTTTGQLYYTSSNAFGGGGGGGGTLKDLQVNSTSYSNAVVLKFSGSNYSGSDDGAGTTTIFFKPNNGIGGFPGQVQYAGASDNFNGHGNFTYDDGVRSLTVPGLSVATATDNIDNRFCAIEMTADLSMGTGYETGKVFMIKCRGGSFNLVAPSGGTIDGNNQITLTDNASVILVHFGSEVYYIMSSYLYP